MCENPLWNRFHTLILKVCFVIGHQKSCLKNISLLFKRIIFIYKHISRLFTFDNDVIITIYTSNQVTLCLWWIYVGWWGQSYIQSPSSSNLWRSSPKYTGQERWRRFVVWCFRFFTDTMSLNRSILFMLAYNNL